MFEQTEERRKKKKQQQKTTTSERRNNNHNFLPADANQNRALAFGWIDSNSLSMTVVPE
jgi:hypothetical protein